MDGDEHLAESPVAALLDRQFRLLREDFLAPLRDELQNIKAVVTAAAANKQGVPRWDKLRKVFQPVYMRAGWTLVDGLASLSAWACQRLTAQRA